MSQPFESFETFWPYYLQQHSDPVCRAFHLGGTMGALACIAAAPRLPGLLLVAPIVGYGLAWVGHFAFEGNRPASWSSPRHAIWSLRGDFRMLKLWLSGRLDSELRRVDT